MFRSRRDHPERYGQLGASTVTPLRTQGPTATPLSILIARYLSIPRYYIFLIVFFSVLSAGWGKGFWYLSVNMSPAYREAIAGADAEVASVFKQKFLKSRRVGGGMSHHPPSFPM